MGTYIINTVLCGQAITTIFSTIGNVKDNFHGHDILVTQILFEKELCNGNNNTSIFVYM